MPIFSKRDLEGYVSIDHRESPGLDHPLLGRGKHFQGPTYTCPYCQRVVIINPQRTRDREYCSKMDRYICDECGAKRKLGVDLIPMKKIIDDLQTAAAHGKSHEFVTEILNKEQFK